MNGFIYELLILSIPQKRIKPNLVFDEVKSLEEEFKKNKKKDLDPRWDQLKQLLDKK